MERTTIVPAGLAAPGGHYSHGIVTSSSRMLWVAGQVAVDEHGDLVGLGDPAAQAHQVLENLRRVVEAAGGRVEDVAKTTVYLTDLHARAAVNEVRRAFFRGDPPANTLLVVTSLARPEYLVEIEAIVPLAN